VRSLALGGLISGASDVGYWDGMDVERTIDDIEQLEEMFKFSSPFPVVGVPLGTPLGSRPHTDARAGTTGCGRSCEWT
jgi:hypothetical protein